MARQKIEALSVLVDGDISGLKRAMNEAVKELNSTERAIKNLNKAAELDPNDINILKSQLATYEKALVDQRKALRELEKDQKQIWNDPNFKRGVTEYTERYSELTKQIAKVKAEEDKLNKGIEETKQLISNFTFNQKFRKITEELDKTRKSFENIKSSVENVNKAIEFDPENIDLYRQKQSLLKTELEKVNEQLANLEKEKKLLSSPLFHKATEEETKRLAENSKETAELIEKKKELNAQMKSPAVEMFNNKMRILGDSLLEIGRATEKLSRAFKVLLTGSFESAKSYESDIANIRRVVNDLTDDTIDDLKRLAVETGTTFSDISQYATIAGALGLSESEISKFAETMTDLNTATGGVFSGEEGAKGIAVFLKQLNLSIDEAENFGSAIAVIGDKYADIGDETVNVATKLTALTSLVKTNQYELIGLAGVMADLGLSGDSNANAINRAFLQIEKAIATDEDKLETLAKTSGMTSKQFVKAWKTDAMNAFLSFTDGLKSSVFSDINKAIQTSDKEVLKFADTLGWTAETFREKWGENSKAVFEQYVEALGEMSEDSESASVVLKDLGIASVNTAQTLLRLSGSGNEVRNAIELTNEAWNENVALTEKSNLIYDTTERKLQGFYESLKQVGVAIADDVLPIVKQFLDKGIELSDEFKKMNPHLRKLTLAFIALGAGISPVTKAFGSFLKFFFKPTWLNGMTQFQVLSSAITTVLNTPLGAVASIATFVGLMHELGQAYAESQTFFQIRDDLEQLNTSFMNVKQSADDNFLSFLDTLDEKSNDYLDTLDLLVERYNDPNTPWKAKQGILDDIYEYIDGLNSSLGTEEFYWDEASKSIKSHTGEINNTKEAYLEYINEVKKQNWLEAHAEEYNQAKDGFKQVETDMIDSTKQFYEDVSDIPKRYVDLFVEAANGTDTVREAVDKFNAMVEENGWNPLTDAQMDELRSSYNDWFILMGQAEENLNQFQSVIDNYTAIEKADAKDFEETLQRIETLKQSNEESSATILESDQEIYRIRDLIATRTGDEHETMGFILADIDAQLEKEQTLDEKLQAQYVSLGDNLARTREIKDETGKIIEEWEEWQPTTKDLQIRLSVTGWNAPSFSYGGVGYGGSYDVPRSGGYGDIGGLLNSINNSLANFRSGGTGITINATFYAGSSSMNNVTARQFARTFGDELNTYLGSLV